MCYIINKTHRSWHIHDTYITHSWYIMTHHDTFMTNSWHIHDTSWHIMTEPERDIIQVWTHRERNNEVTYLLDTGLQAGANQTNVASISRNKMRKLKCLLHFTSAKKICLPGGMTSLLGRTMEMVLERMVRRRRSMLGRGSRLLGEGRG